MAIQPITVTDGHELAEHIGAIGMMISKMRPDFDVTSIWPAAMIVGMDIMVRHPEWGIAALKMVGEAGMPSPKDAVNMIVETLRLEVRDE